MVLATTASSVPTTKVTISNGIVDKNEELKKLHIDEDKQHLHDTTGLPSKRIVNAENYAHLLKYMSLMVLVIQNTSQVLVMRYATTRNPTEYAPFLKTVAVFFNEVVKFLAALVLFFFSTGDFRKSLSLLHHHFITNFLDTLKVGVPAFIYVMQNFLLYVAVENLDAGTYMVTYQMKILTTAMFTVLMLKRKLSVQQWVALLVLIAGVAIVQYSANQKRTSSAEKLIAVNTTMSPIMTLMDGTNSVTKAPLEAISARTEHEQSPLLGFITIIIACFLSGFAGIYFEKILKASDVSVWLRNTQLAALSIPIGLIVIAVKDGHRVQAKGFMQGFDAIVWLVVLLQALGGLVVAVVIKYADNILKAFATSVSIVVATVTSIFIFSIYPRLLFVGGAVLVIGAVVLYGAFPYRKNGSIKKKYLAAAAADDADSDKIGDQELQVIVKKATLLEEDKVSEEAVKNHDDEDDAVKADDKHKEGCAEEAKPCI